MYKLYESTVVKENYSSFIRECDIVYQKFGIKFKSSDSTWMYDQYNLFSLSSNSTLFYDFYKELSFFIKDYIGDNKRIWIESWINYHSYSDLEEKLKYHYHDFDYHGYIAIDPKNSTTHFPNANYEIKNKPAQVYIGPSGPGYEHAVIANEKYSGRRITIAFNISLRENNTYINNHFYPLI